MLKLAPAALSVVLLAACAVPEPTLNDTSTPTAAPPAQQSATTGRAPSGDVEWSCYNVVNSQTKGDVSVLSNQPTENGSLVLLAVAESPEPWRCVVGSDGTISEVGYGAER